MQPGTEPLWKADSLPFTLGVFPTCHNPDGLPDTLPFTLTLDVKLGLVRQAANPVVSDHLHRAYEVGSLLGTAMDDTPLGRAYADDFLAFAASVRSLAGCRAIEIGAGRGYLVRRLGEAGADAIGIEPGRQNAAYWSKHGVRVIAGTFPDAAPAGPFDAILAYAVLEHIADPEQLLSAARDRLGTDGVLLLSVPDETPYLAAGDPGMLLHEHFLYFTQASLGRLIRSAGFRVIAMRKAGYGGAIYCAAVRDALAAAEPPSTAELTAARTFSEKCRAVRAAVAAELENADGEHRIGIYCPARGLALMPLALRARFFDDDAELAGLFYPPFAAPVEGRKALLERPVSKLLILSRTFGAQLKKQLEAEDRMKSCVIRTIEEIVDGAQDGAPAHRAVS